MVKQFKSSFVWQFAGGFVLGAIGLFVLQPADARQVDRPVAAAAAVYSVR